MGYRFGTVFCKSHKLYGPDNSSWQVFLINEKITYLSSWSFHTKIVSILFTGILSDIQKDFNIKNNDGGLLQTAFIVSYMIFAPLFGYLGDRYNRKIIMSFGVFLWCLTTLVGSYMQVNSIIFFSADLDN